MIGAVHVKYQFGKAVAQFRDPPQTNYENSLSDLMYMYEPSPTCEMYKRRCISAEP